MMDDAALDIEFLVFMLFELLEEGLFVCEKGVTLIELGQPSQSLLVEFVYLGLVIV